jgi:hypothetical protein
MNRTKSIIVQIDEDREEYLIQTHRQIIQSIGNELERTNISHLNMNAVRLIDMKRSHVAFGKAINECRSYRIWIQLAIVFID